MSAIHATAPGDRYLTTAPCGPQCCSSPLTEPASASSPSSSSPSSLSSALCSSAWVAVQPYSFVFNAPVKGRWLGRGLLELFLREFAFVPSTPTSIPDGQKNEDEGEGESCAELSHSVTRSAVVPLLLQQHDPHQHGEGVRLLGGGATLDRRLTLPAYVEELCDGALWLQRRDGECRAVGRSYRSALTRVAHARGAASLVLEAESLASASGAPAAADVDGWSAWCRTVLWLSRLPSESDVDALLPELHAEVAGLPTSNNATSTITTTSPSANGCPAAPLLPPPSSTLLSSSSSSSLLSSPPPPLLLRQRDVVRHLVWRREGRMFAHPPLQVLRCDVSRVLSAPAGAAQVPALMVVSKPPGLPVHPSGCYRKNSVTSILEDVFGGCDAGGQFYYAEEHFADEEAEDEGKKKDMEKDEEKGEATAVTSVPEGAVAQPFRPYVSIRHRREGFELIRVFVRLTDTDSSSGAAGWCSDSVGVSLDDWRILKVLLERGTGTRDAGAKDGPVKSRPTADGTTAPRERPHTCDKREREEARGVPPPDRNATSSECATSPLAQEDIHPSSNSTARAAGTAAPLCVPADYALKAFVVHRLDAATSGVLLFGLSSESARRTAVAIANKADAEGGDRDQDDAEEAGGGRGGDEEKSNMKASGATQRKAGVSAAEAEAERSGVAGGGSGSSAPSPAGSSSLKVYYARVHGRVDLASLALSQHHCALRRCAAATADPGSSAAVELVVQRPIGCLDHHHSLYWCPDAALTDAWLAHRQQQQQQAQEGPGAQAPTAAEPPTSSSRTSGPPAAGAPAAKKTKTSRTPEDIAAKHERMRQLTCGGAAPLAFSHSDASTEAMRRVGQYTQTLRTATTVLRLVLYDAEKNESVVQCTLGTGRTHQLRVHLASLGHPIVADSKYLALEAFLRQSAAALQRSPSAHKDVTERDTLTVTAGGSGGGGADMTCGATSASASQRAADAPISLFYSTMDSTSGEGGAEGATPAWKAVMFAETRTARGCVCPDAICLHAWRYTLTYEDCGAEVRVEVPLPGWAES